MYLGSYLRTCSRNETRRYAEWQAQEGPEGSASRHIGARCPDLDKGEEEGLQAGHESVQLLWCALRLG